MTAPLNDTTETTRDAGTVPVVNQSSSPHKQYDIIVIGAGVAGLAFTLSLPPELRVALLTKGVLGESNTRYAQGGLSAAVGTDDSPALHAADTLTAGAGLSDAEAVARLV
jgi:L-aspartate oxidase